MGWGGVCKVIFMSNPTVVLRLGWGFDNKLKFMWCVGGGRCPNENLVVGFGPNLACDIWPRAKPIKESLMDFVSCQISG